MSRRRTEYLQALLRAPDDSAPTSARQNPSTGEPTTDDRSRPTRIPPAVEAGNPAVPAYGARVSETLEQQNELLRAILASTVDTQTDARATAQNSRTFAWAGTLIALLTFIATVVSIIAAVEAN